MQRRGGLVRGTGEGERVEWREGRRRDFLEEESDPEKIPCVM